MQFFLLLVSSLLFFFKGGVVVFFGFFFLGGGGGGRLVWFFFLVRQISKQKRQTKRSLNGVISPVSKKSMVRLLTATTENNFGVCISGKGCTFLF